MKDNRKTMILTCLLCLLPMALGLVLGAVGISAAMSWLFRRFYTVTYCVIFGVFLSMIPQMLTENCVPGWNPVTLLSLILTVVGFGVSWYLGDFQANNARLRAWLKKKG